MEFPRVRDERADHSFPVWAQSEKCHVCSKPAAHKVGELSGPQRFHELTAYLCCDDFATIMGSAHESYPYDFDEFYKALTEAQNKDTYYNTDNDPNNAQW